MNGTPLLRFFFLVSFPSVASLGDGKAPSRLASCSLQRPVSWFCAELSPCSMNCLWWAASPP